MPIEPISDDALLETLAALEQSGDNKAQASRLLGIDVSTFRKRLKVAAKRGLYTPPPPQAPPGMEVKTRKVALGPDGKVRGQSIQYRQQPGEAFQVPKGHAVKGESALLDPDGRVVAKWVKTAREHEKNALAIAETLKDAFATYHGRAKPLPPPDHADQDLLSLFPLADWHLGLYVWGKEAAGENWDLKIATTQLFGTFQKLMATAAPTGTCVLLGGGDLLHSDNYEARTARSGNSLDVDGRWPKVLQAAGQTLARMTELALQRHERVVVRLLPGNHDEQSAIATTYFLDAWFRNEPRVTVDTDPSLFWWHRHGSCLFGATHGHTVKIQDMPSIMAHRRAEDWGQTSHRYIHGFHLHHKQKLATEGEGVICEIHQSPTPQDAWHHGSGFLSGRSMKVITYHKQLGEIGQNRLTMGGAP